MAFWCKGKKDYCGEEECDSCKFKDGSGGIEIDDDENDGVIIRQWISVKDRLPEAYADGSVPAVLVTDGEFIHMAYCSHNNWFFCENGEMKGDMFYFVSHWMPLPEPPKEE